MIKSENLAETLKTSAAISSRVKLKKRKRRFWKIFGAYLAVLAGGLIIMLSLLWHFLDCYEQTRPKYYMDEHIMKLWKDGDISELLDNCDASWPTDDGAPAVNTYLGKYLKDKQLSYGKLPGYSELKPYYGIQADGVTIASILLNPSDYGTDFGFNFWEPGRLEIYLTGKDFYVSIPSNMTAYIEGINLSENYLVSRKAYRNDVPEGFPECSLYKITYYDVPKVVATDRFGTQKQLEYKEENNLLYYDISYVTVPYDVRIYADGRELSAANILKAGIKAEGTFDFLYELKERFKEYESIEETLPIPTYTSYYVDFIYEKLTATDRLGKPYDLRAEENQLNFKGESFTSDDKMYGESSGLAMKMAEAFALFLTKDLPFDAVKPYLLEDSEYSKLLSLYDRALQKHTYPSFEKEEILEYKGYNDNLVYVVAYLEQHMKSRGVDIVNKIKYPMWLIRADNKWYVAGIDFTAFDNDYEKYF